MNVQEITVINCKHYASFVREIFSIGFEERPNYERLIGKLKMAIGSCNRTDFEIES